MAGLPLVGDEFAGYRVRAVLGRGGMSVVYQAENLRLSSVIALKVLAPELAADDVFRARFLEESRIAASLNHPNVIPIYDMGSQDDLLYIAMRYVSGTDMRQMIKKRGRILPATALFLIGQAARALDAAHRKGLVHRDVKPGNLLIERGADEDDPDHVYLADFGITKHAMSRSGLTSTGQFLGTIDYVAPEQIRGTSVLGLADQYSLGCVLYECLTGRVPFEKDLDAAIIWAHVEETPMMPTVLRPELPPQIDEVFGRVLSKRPDERYGSCREFVQAAQLAMGIFGPGSESPTSYGATTADPATRPRGITPVRRPSVPPDQFSWSGRISQPSAPVPVAPDPVAPGSAPPGPRTARPRTARSRPAGITSCRPATRRRLRGRTARSPRTAASTARRIRVAPVSQAPPFRRPGRRPPAAGTALVPPAALDRRAGGRGPDPRRAWAPGLGYAGPGRTTRLRRRRCPPKPKQAHDERADGRAHAGQQERRRDRPDPALHLQARPRHRGDLLRPARRDQRGGLPDLPEPAGAVHRVHGQGRLPEHRRQVQAELQRLRVPAHLRRDRLEPPVPPHQQVHRRPDDHREQSPTTRPRAACSAPTPRAWSTWSGPRTTATCWATWPARSTPTYGTGGSPSTTTSASAAPPMNMQMPGTSPSPSPSKTGTSPSPSMSPSASMSSMGG